MYWTLVDLLRLKTSCSANNDCLSLLSFYHLETQVYIDEFKVNQCLNVLPIQHTITIKIIMKIADIIETQEDNLKT
jgi:hypothetical protein